MARRRKTVADCGKLYDRARRWKPVPGFREFYEVSDDGLVRTIFTYRHWIPRPIHRLRRLYRKNGYWAVDLHHDRTQLHCYVHRLVWEAFKGPIPSGREINHRDGNRTNNRLRNLELVSRSENIRHCIQFLNPKRNPIRGADHHKAKLKPHDIPAILELYRSGVTQKDIAKRYSVSNTA